MRKFFLFVCAFSTLVSPAFAQALSGLPAATQAGTTLNITCPTTATVAQVWRATGSSSTVTLTSTNWGQLPGALGTVPLTAGVGSVTDITGVIGTTYGYSAICTEGSLIAPPTSIYFGTPTAPLVAGTLSGTTS